MTKANVPPKKTNGKRDPITDQLNRMSSFASGARSAFGCGMMQEFGNGGTGVVEMHYKNRLPVRVVVRAADAPGKPKNIRGVSAEWELTPQQLAEVITTVVNRQ